MVRGVSVIAGFVVLLFLGMPAPSSAAQFDAIYVIGDSLSDQGNLFGATNVLPASDHYFNGRFSNGPVYTDALAQRLGLLLGPSLAGGNNFAYGGARTTYNTVEMSVGGPFPTGAFPWSLNAEVQAFNARGVHNSDALYIVLSGSNDIGDIVSRSMNPAVVIPNVVNGILGAVQAFQNAGATTIIVGNVPDLGLTPAFRSLGPPASNPASIVSNQFNLALQAALSGVAGPNIIQFQTDDFVNSLVSNPGQFGLSNVTTPCYSGFVVPNPGGTECSNPNEFLFWDLVHPTAVVHSLLADAILGAVPEPETYAMLLAGLGLVGFMARRRKRAS